MYRPVFGFVLSGLSRNDRREAFFASYFSSHFLTRRYFIIYYRSALGKICQNCRTLPKADNICSWRIIISFVRCLHTCKDEN
jgi:hypothetical protein